MYFFSCLWMKDFWRERLCICFMFLMFLYYIVKYSVISWREFRILIERKSPHCTINICWLTKWLSEYSWPNHKKAAVDFLSYGTVAIIGKNHSSGEYIYARWLFFQLIYIANAVVSQIAISHWFLLKPSVKLHFLIPIMPDTHFLYWSGDIGAVEVRLTSCQSSL